jgi:ligand-binding SRPBCC domain-containing protein
MMDYKVRSLGLPMRRPTLITEFIPPHRFVYLRLRGPCVHWHHSRSFLETEDGTIVTDELRDALPFGIPGQAVHAPVVRRRQTHMFDFRERIHGQCFCKTSTTDTPETVRSERP